MLRDFQMHLVKALKLLQQDLLDDIRSGMKTPEGQGDLSAEEIQILGAFLTANVRGGPWAILDSFGRGSLLDDSNPALLDYMKSDFWNDLRGLDFAIRSRAPGSSYRDFFTGEMRTSRAKKGGINLERINPEKYGPRPPSKAFQTALNFMRQKRFWDVCEQALMTFDFGKYLKVTNTKL